MKKALDNQIQFKNLHNDIQYVENKKPVRTSFGPEENALLFAILERRNEEAKLSTKQDLESLINERHYKNQFVNQLERNLDQNMVDNTVKAYHEEQRERKALDQQRKQDLKNAWIEQAIINEKQRDIENLFN